MPLARNTKTKKAITTVSAIIRRAIRNLHPNIDGKPTKIFGKKKKPKRNNRKRGFFVRQVMYAETRSMIPNVIPSVPKR
jgi:hypothetical protein